MISGLLTLLATIKLSDYLFGCGIYGFLACLCLGFSVDSYRNSTETYWKNLSARDIRWSSVAVALIPLGFPLIIIVAIAALLFGAYALGRHLFGNVLTSFVSTIWRAWHQEKNYDIPADDGQLR